MYKGKWFGPHMLIIKTALLLFALFVAFDSHLSWWTRIFGCLGAVALEQYLNYKSDQEYEQYKKGKK